MGFFWDLLQQHQIGQQRTQSGNAEERIAQLERGLTINEQIIEQMARRLDELENEIYGEQNG